MSAKAALTTGEIARRLKVPVHRVSYIVRSRRIKASCRAGIIRVFDEEAYDTIASDVKAIDGSRAVAS